MKTEEHKEARRLRQAGLSIKEIEKQLGVARSSVSIWVRDIALSDSQKKCLEENANYTRGQRLGSETNRKKALEIRRHYQELGREKAQENDFLHLAGCMLYWAEGAKSRTDLKFCNSDANMMVFFLKFLCESLQLPVERITIRIICYTDCKSLADIEAYWLKTLNLPKTCLRKSSVLKHPEDEVRKRQGKLPYGVCHLQVLRGVEIVQHIYGAIQEYTKLNNPTWIK